MLEDFNPAIIIHTSDIQGARKPPCRVSSIMRRERAVDDHKRLVEGENLLLGLISMSCFSNTWKPSIILIIKKGGRAYIARNLVSTLE